MTLTHSGSTATRILVKIAQIYRGIQCIIQRKEDGSVPMELLALSPLTSFKGTIAMIMVLTQDKELREQLSDTLQQSGHKVAVPAHRENGFAMLTASQPSLIILDLQVSDLSGIDLVRMIRARGYGRGIIVFSSPSMMSTLSKTYASGVNRVLKAPVAINGRYDLGELRSTVKSCLQNQAASARPPDHGIIAKRAYELYEAGGRHEGFNLQHWFQAEREVGMR